MAKSFFQFLQGEERKVLVHIPETISLPDKELYAQYEDGYARGYIAFMRINLQTTAIERAIKLFISSFEVHPDWWKKVKIEHQVHLFGAMIGGTLGFVSHIVTAPTIFIDPYIKNEGQSILIATNQMREHIKTHFADKHYQQAVHYLLNRLEMILKEKRASLLKQGGDQQIYVLENVIKILKS